MARMASPLELLVLRTGHTHPDILRRHGDYDQWLGAAIATSGARLRVVHVPEADPPAEAVADGIVVTGSSASVLDDERWMRRLRAWLEEVAASPEGPPVLAICFGAQLAAASIGGRVERSPGGWEIGTIEVTLTPEGQSDPLFAGVPDRFAVQATHEDGVVRLPPRGRLLARNDHTSMQACRIGTRLHAVQFHPEASAALIGDLVHLRRRRLMDDALRHGAADERAAAMAVDRIEDGLRETPWGTLILENWLRLCGWTPDAAPADGGLGR